MNSVSKEQVIEILNTLGIAAGDGLLVHSALQFLGRPHSGEGMYLEALQSVIGPQGTIAVPTFNFAFTKGEDYDPLTAPSVGMGAFSEYVRQLPEALRTTHPMQSRAGIGAPAQQMAGRDTPSAFDDGSAFVRMLELDFKLLLLGADIEASSIAHYSELRAEVPYRYWKDFTGRILLNNDWETCTYRMFVRDLKIDPLLTGVPVQALLEIKGQWTSQPLTYGFISVCSMRDFVATTDEILAMDVWSLVTNQPADQYISKSG
ncbi:MAG: AAC(3) family N-acetyltransferase [Chloroflexota bacterium]